MTRAMPVAEEKPVEPVAPVAPVASESVQAPKPDEVQPQIKADTTVLEESKPEQVIENKEVVKPQEPELKSVPVESKPEEAKPEAAVAIVTPEVKSEVPEPKLAAPVEAESEVKPENNQSEAKPEEKKEEPEEKKEKPEEKKEKPEEKKEEPEQKSAVEEPKQVSDAKVVEVKEAPYVINSKTETIDVVAAIKSPAAVADDVVDVAALSPAEKAEVPVVTTKSAEPVAEDKKEESSSVPAAKTSLT
ncbi:unnamed protein product, partial [Parnassius mnemosyne]